MRAAVSCSRVMPAPRLTRGPTHACVTLVMHRSHHAGPAECVPWPARRGAALTVLLTGSLLGASCDRRRRGRSQGQPDLPGARLAASYAVRGPRLRPRPRDVAVRCAGCGAGRAGPRARSWSSTTRAPSSARPREDPRPRSPPTPPPTWWCEARTGLRRPRPAAPRTDHVLPDNGATQWRSCVGRAAARVAVPTGRGRGGAGSRGVGTLRGRRPVPRQGAAHVVNPAAPRPTAVAARRPPQPGSPSRDTVNVCRWTTTSRASCPRRCRSPGSPRRSRPGVAARTYAVRRPGRVTRDRYYQICDTTAARSTAAGRRAPARQRGVRATAAADPHPGRRAGLHPVLVQLGRLDRRGQRSPTCRAGGPVRRPGGQHRPRLVGRP